MHPLHGLGYGKQHHALLNKQLAIDNTMGSILLTLAQEIEKHIMI